MRRIYVDANVLIAGADSRSGASHAVLVRAEVGLFRLVVSRQILDEAERNIRRNSRKKYSRKDKIRIVLEGLRGEVRVAKLCRQEGISESLYYRWSKEFLKAGKERLVGNTRRQATSDDVRDLRTETKQYKQLVAELALKNRILKKV